MTVETCFNRKPYLQSIEKRVAGLKDGYRQNLALVGDELIGKTTILSQFIRKFYDPRFVFIYLETRPETMAMFCRRFVAVMLYNFLQGAQIPLKEDLEFLIDKASGHIPATVEKIRAVMADAQKRKKNSVFSDLIALPELLHKETGKYCVVIFDEFLGLEQLGCRDLYKEWAQALMAQKATMYIIASSRKARARTVLSKELNLLFGNFEVLTVEPFDIIATEEYLGARLAHPVSVGVRNFIVHFTGGHPFYLSLICEALNKEKTAGVADILDESLFSSSGSLNQKFLNFLKRFQDTENGSQYISILQLVASGQNKAKDIAHVLRRPKKLIDQRVGYLLDIDALGRCGDFLRVNDRVFGFWLKFVYQQKLQSLTLDAAAQQEHFRRQIEAMLEEFLHQSDRSVPARLTEIMRLFSDERVKIDRNKITLNHFREIKPLSFGAKGLREGLLCRSNDATWVLGFNYGLLTEEDIADFSRECRKYRSKLDKKIIVTLRDPEPNSRLKALEEKVVTWDLNSLNEIFDLFSKPRIIV